MPSSQVSEKCYKVLIKQKATFLLREHFIYFVAINNTTLLWGVSSDLLSLTLKMWLILYLKCDKLYISSIGVHCSKGTF